MNTKKFLTAVVAVSALFATGSAFAGGHHRGEDRNSGIRLAADIVHLVKSVVTPTVVVQQPSPAVVVQQPSPAVVVQQPSPSTVVVQQPSPVVVTPAPSQIYYCNPPPPPRHGPRRHRPGRW